LLNEFISSATVDGVQLDLFPDKIPERGQAILHGDPVMVIDEKHAEALFLRQEHKLLHIICPVTERCAEIHQAYNLLVICSVRLSDVKNEKKKDDRDR
jgi:hypothetical protein